VLLSDVQYVSSSTTQGTCTYVTKARSVTCGLGQLAAGQSVTVQILVTSTSLQPITNCAVVSSTTPDPDPSNNRSCFILQR
jgi:hypothetical protein